ncbi:hypothetical protein ACQ4PT_002242 [Festuca glaucescens]
MVFSSVPLYLDPPNWNNQQQQQQHQQLSHHVQLFPSAGGAGVEVHPQQQQHQHNQQQHQQQQQQHVHQQHQLPPPGTLMAPRSDSMGGGAIAVNGGGGGGGGPTSGGAAPRPGSMTDRARMAKIPQPEPGLKCPRCESTNTKFCYFNNYSLTQPRHFCKTCRRYWTRGGALRSVPVGGGCRRNKRKSSKSSSSAASASGGTSSSTSSTTTGGGNSGAASIMPPQAGNAQSQMPFFASLHPMGSGGGDHYGTGTGASRLGFPGLSSLDPVGYQLGGGGAVAAALGMEQWRMPQMQQFPFFGRADGMHQQQMAAIYPFDAATADADGFAVTGQMIGGGVSKQVPGSSGLITQLASVKMEDNQPSNNAMASAASAREFLGLPGNLQFWGSGNNGAGGNDSEGSQSGGAIAPGGGGGGWVDLPGFNSSSSGNIM